MSKASSHWPTARSARRLPMFLSATCRTGEGRIFNVALSDLSAQGCCIRIGQNHLKPNDRVAVKTEGLEPLIANVCWVRDYQAGVQFERPIYEPVLDHLARLYSG